MTYKAPSFKEKSFTCPSCGAFAHMDWGRLLDNSAGVLRQSRIYQATCAHCDGASTWRGTHLTGPEWSQAVMVFPNAKTAPLPHNDMPVDVRADYDEAREVADQSPRAAAALLRLCIQKLCIHLGEPGKNINTDIGALVKRGLPPDIQKALDVVRVVGNNSVHPGELSYDDVAAISTRLFELVNYIVEDRISRPAQLAKLYSELPQQALEGIERRDRG